ncbi:MAG: dTMP kinase [Blastocatellia bacterium]|nr:dTMP kinase [Blastocatellia bacterium]
MTQGRLITFEGVDGCGKTTQLRLVSERCDALGIPFLATRQPGGTPLGLKIREILLPPTPVDAHSALSYESLPVPTPVAEALLFAADRAQHVETVIRPALAAGKLVLCDRYTDSTIAYQGYGRGRDIKVIEQLVAIATDGLKPDATLLFDLPVAESQNRLQQSRQGSTGTPDRLDVEPLEFHQAVRDGFLKLAAAEPKRFHLLDARSEIKQLHQEVWNLLDRILGGKPSFSV